MFYIMHELAVMSLSLPAETLLEQLPGAPHACHSPGQHQLFCGAVFAGQDTSHSSQNISTGAWGDPAGSQSTHCCVKDAGGQGPKAQGLSPREVGEASRAQHWGSCVGAHCPHGMWGQTLPFHPHCLTSVSSLTQRTQRTHSRIPMFYRKDNVLSLNPVPGAEAKVSIPPCQLSSSCRHLGKTHLARDPTLCHFQPSALPQKLLPKNPGANLGL